MTTKKQKTAPEAASSGNPAASPFDSVILRELQCLCDEDWGGGSHATHRLDSDLIVGRSKALGTAARRGDQRAILLLFMMALSAEVQLSLVMRDPDSPIHAASRQCLVWPALYSPVACVARAFRSICRLAEVGSALARSMRFRRNLLTPTNSMATKLLGFLVLLRRDLVGGPMAGRWSAAAKDLPRLSAGAVPRWWNLAKRVARDMYPDLQRILYPPGHRAEKQAYGDAIDQLHAPFMRIWRLFEHVDIETQAQPRQTASVDEPLER